MKNLTSSQVLQVSAGSTKQEDLQCAAKFAFFGGSTALLTGAVAGLRGLTLAAGTCQNIISFGVLGLVYSAVKNTGE